MKSKILVLVSFISISSYGLELPKKMLLFNPIDLAQQKLSLSYLKQTKKLNFLQINGNIRAITNYEYMPDYIGNTEPPAGSEIQPFSKLYGWHIGAGIGYKLINKHQPKPNKIKYWQPTLSAKFAREDLVFQRFSWNIPRALKFNNHQYYAFGLEINNGRITKGKKFFKDFYYGVGVRLIYNKVHNFYYDYTADVFYNQIYLAKNKTNFTGSVILNLGLKFGKGV